MPFTSSLFIVFIAVFLPVFFLLELKSRRWALVFVAASSFFFVLVYFPIYAAIPCCQAIVLFLFQRQKKKSRLLLGGAIAVVLLPLIVFKYYDFIAENAGLPTAGLTLPLGISFYTFTAIGFMIDLYARKYELSNLSYLESLNLLTFWPHLASGPILRGNDFFGEKQRRFLWQRDVVTAIVLLVFGLYKKIVIGDGVGGLVNQNLQMGIDGMGPYDAATTMLGFSSQIYCDFSGYSDMALGFAILLGIYIPANFNYPYCARSVTEFWHRWHISLSTWFRDYLYIPLGGNRGGLVVNCLVLMFVFCVSGFWHGAAWNFVIWGAVHGLLLIAHRLIRLTGIRFPSPVGWVVTFSCVTVAWSFFFLDFASAWDLVSSLWKANPGEKLAYNNHWVWVYFGLVVLDFAVKPYKVRERTVKATRMGMALCPFAIVLMFYFAGKPLPFIYFDF